MPKRTRSLKRSPSPINAEELMRAPFITGYPSDGLVRDVKLMRQPIHPPNDKEWADTLGEDENKIPIVRTKKDGKSYHVSYMTKHPKTSKGGKGKWSRKYKKSINCNHPRGFSQKQYCKYSRKGGRTLKRQ